MIIKILSLWWEIQSLTNLSAFMRESKSTAKPPMEFLVNNIVSFYKKVCSPPYCCAVLLDPRPRLLITETPANKKHFQYLQQTQATIFWRNLNVLWTSSRLYKTIGNKPYRTRWNLSNTTLVQKIVSILCFIMMSALWRLFLIDFTLSYIN